LRIENSVNDDFSLLKKLFFESKKSFPSKIYGNYTGIVYDKNKKEVYLFTPHNGTKTLFYFFDKENKILIFDNSLKYVIDLMRENGYKVELDDEGTYCLVTVGYMIGERTLIKNVKKLKPATIFKFDGGSLSYENFFKISSYPSRKIDENVIIEELDNLFVEAFKTEYDKDLK